MICVAAKHRLNRITCCGQFPNQTEKLPGPNSALAHREFSGYHPRLITRRFSGELRAKSLRSGRVAFTKNRTKAYFRDVTRKCHGKRPPVLGYRNLRFVSIQTASGTPALGGFRKEKQHQPRAANGRQGLRSTRTRRTSVATCSAPRSVETPLRSANFGE